VAVVCVCVYVCEYLSIFLILQLHSKLQATLSVLELVE
jgi:hypothetical protein